MEPRSYTPSTKVIGRAAAFPCVGSIHAGRIGILILHAVAAAGIHQYESDNGKMKEKQISNDSRSAPAHEFPGSIAAPLAVDEQNQGQPGRMG
jgi:hypothetical protein